MTGWMMRPAVFWGLLGLALAVVYLPGLGNPLVFDDGAVTRAIESETWRLWPLRARALSYGTFFWLDQVAPGAIWVQRVASLLLHAGVAVALYGFFKALTRHVRDDGGQRSITGTHDSSEAALRLGIVAFALNPAAVYGVAYLTQRSIVMATLFAVLACWAFVKGLEGRGWLWFPLATLSYLASMLSKEHAVMVAAVSVPLYIFVRRPAFRPTAIVTLSVLTMLSLALWIFRGAYLSLIWSATAEPWGPQLLEQLEALQPGVSGKILLLGIMNQMTLFFVYGFLWLIPYVGWMSIDLRPPFPLTPWSFPYWLGALAFGALVLTSGWLVIRRSSLMGFAGLCVLAATILFTVEFATVRLQEPLVLYRSYLWAMVLPGLLWAMVSHIDTVRLAKATLVVGLLLTASAFERQQTFRSELALWSDAIEKIDTSRSEATLGRWRAFVNRGNAYRADGQMALAAQDYVRAIELGVVDGGGHFGYGAALQGLGLHHEALNEFDAAAARGLNHPGLYFHRGESLFALNRYTEAVDAYRQALSRDRGGEGGILIRIRLGEAANADGQYSLAQEVFEALVSEISPDIRFLTGLGLALLGLGDHVTALAYFDAVLDVRPVADALYGRARAKRVAGNRLGAQQDIAEALRMDPSNPAYQSLYDILR